VPIKYIAQTAILVKVKNVSSELLFVAVPSEGITEVITGLNFIHQRAAYRKPVRPNTGHDEPIHINSMKFINKK